jgi:hypothetical protein
MGNCALAEGLLKNLPGVGSRKALLPVFPPFFSIQKSVPVQIELRILHQLRVHAAVSQPLRHVLCRAEIVEAWDGRRDREMQLHGHGHAFGVPATNGVHQPLIIEAPWISTPLTAAGQWRARRLNKMAV